MTTPCETCGGPAGDEEVADLYARLERLERALERVLRRFSHSASEGHRCASYRVPDHCGPDSTFDDCTHGFCEADREEIRIARKCIKAKGGET